MDKLRFQVRVELPDGDFHRFSIIPSLSFSALHSHLLQISGLTGISVTYLDEEGDKVTLTNEEEFVEAKRALDIGSIASLRLAVTVDANAKPPTGTPDKPRPTPRSGTAGKTRKVGHYPELAEEVGELVHGSAPKELESASKNTQTVSETNNSSPEWKDSFVSNASREISSVLDSLLKSVTAEPSSLLTTSSNTACHLGILCSICNKTIIGNRYKCGNCPQFDLCELCLLKPDAHDPTHVLLLLRLPCPSAGYTDGRSVPILQENIYSPRAVSSRSLSRAGSEQSERQTAAAHVYMDKKLRKAMKLERKMKKVFPQHVDAQVEAFKSNIQNKRKEIKDMKEMLKATKRFGYVPFSHEERPERTTPTQLSSSEYSARIVRDKGECLTVFPCQRTSCKWLVENNGQSFWGSVRFHCVSGSLLSEERQISLPFCSSGDQIELEVPFTAPEEQGYYYSNWRLSHYGKAFGPSFKAECRVCYNFEQELLRKNVEVDSGAEDDEDLASADQGFAIKAFPGTGGMQQPLIAISHGDYLEDPLVNSMQVLPIEDNDSIDLDATELIQDERPTSSLFSDDLLIDSLLPNDTASSPPLDIPIHLMSNMDTASIASSSTDSFIVVQMPDSFDSNKPIYLTQGSEIVPATLLSDTNKDIDSSEFSSPISSPEPVSPSAVPSLPPNFSTHSPQPNVSITCLSSISPMSSIKSFVSSVADKLDDSLNRSPTPKQQQEDMFSSTYEDFKPFEIEFDIETSLPQTAQDPALTPLAITPTVPIDSSFSLPIPSSQPVYTAQSTNASPPVFNPELPSTESFMLSSAASVSFNAEALTATDTDMWLSQTHGTNLNPHIGQDNSKWIASPNTFSNFSITSDNEAWIAPSTHWKPKQPNTPFERLMKMGFCNRELNLRLLEKYKDNLELVINSLIEESHSAWQNN